MYEDLPPELNERINAMTRDSQILLDLGQYTRAKQGFEEINGVLLEAQPVGKRYHKGQSLHNLGYATFQSGNPQGALKHFVLAYIEDLLSQAEGEEDKADALPAGKTVLNAYRLDPSLMAALKGIIQDTKKQGRIMQNPDEVLTRLDESARDLQPVETDPPLATEKKPKVFVSYAHEEPEHGDWVERFATDLRLKGIDVSLDRWDLLYGQDVPFFMESQIRDSDLIIVVCTPLYATKSNIPVGGVGYEKNIISAEMLRRSGADIKVIPIIKKGCANDALPTYLSSKYAADFTAPQVYQERLDEVIRQIYQQPHPRKPPLGKTPFV